jgi:hypothetical protein
MNLSDKAKEAVSAYLAKFGIDLPAKKVEPAPAKLEDVKLLDGTMLSVDKIEVGAMATFTGEDGVAIPAEGEFELEDGTKIVCMAGVISEIKPKEDNAPVEEAAPVESEMKAILSKLSERLDAIEKTNTVAKTTLEAELSETKKGLVVALGAINEFNDKAVALSLESQKPKKVSQLEFSKMTEFQKYQLAKHGEIKY